MRGEGPAAGYSTLAVEGAKESAGSVGHPDGCTPCTFYCFTRRGCNRGAGCKFCHMTHQSKLQQRREAWKKQQREKRKLMRGFAHKEEVMAEAPLPRPVSRNKKPLEEQAFKGGGSSVKSVVFTYTPSRVTLTMGQRTEIRPALFGPTATRRFSCLGRLPEGLNLDALTGTISGQPTAGCPWEVFTIQVEMMDGQTAQTGLEIEVVDFSRGGFVVGHISEVTPGRFMLVVYKPEEAEVKPQDVQNLNLQSSLSFQGQPGGWISS
ncbi:unnamed protein product [Effrenium voratum]|uniref:C3H1-type domain-containing protein n=1 Tax=Effrenium voratum TaxID=2562239 RepID=A0AA36HJX4_9DINO|nr:unnamed protein product [Effrenium voratum]